jgi:flagellar motor protein MotB
MLTAKGLRGEGTLVPDDTEANRQKNRRVEFVVQPK